MSADDERRLLAAALTGDADALRAAAAGDPAVAARHRVGPALAARAAAAGIGGPAVDAWRGAARAAAATWMSLEPVLRAAGAALGAAGLRWLPIKGCDLARRVYEREEERPTSDVDLLVAGRDLDAARDALAAAGWRGADDPRIERYLREEGYAWQATRPGRPGQPLLELHHRLWGVLPAAAGDAVVAAATPDPGLPAGGCAPALADAWLVAAVHALTLPRPRPLLALWDLERLADAGAAPAGIAAAARLHDVQLPAALAADAAAGVFPHRAHRSVAAALAGELRLPEAAVLARARRRGPDAVSFPRLVLARLLAGRASRLGWRSVWRRLWPHPGVVAMETPPGPWPRRRLAHCRAQIRRSIGR